MRCSFSQQLHPELNESLRDVSTHVIESWTVPAHQLCSVLQLIGGDPDKDIAVLQLECETSKMQETKPVSLGQSSNLLVGQKVYAIGNPFGLDHTLTQGIVSGVGRELNTPGTLCCIECLNMCNMILKGA